MRLVKWHRELVQSGPEGFIDYLACSLFFPLSFLFGSIARLRVFLYLSGFLRSFRASVPVVSIGNIAVGGTGKTPATDFLVKRFTKQGLKIAVVSRGYGRSSDEAVTVVSSGTGPLVPAEIGGDEPVLLSQRNPEAIVVVSSDRKKGIVEAVENHDVDLILLDDGFQHLRVKRDIDILLLDAAKPFGNGFPLPFGHLREFPAAVERADIIFLTRSDGSEKFRANDKPVFHVCYKLASHAVDIEGNKTELGKLKHGRIGAFAGIANPESFYISLQTVGISPVKTVSFPDHNVYDTKEKAILHGLASQCDLLLTTEKDLVKLRNVELPCDCLAVPLDLRIDESGKLESYLDEFIMQMKEKSMLSEDLIEILACPKCKGAIEYIEEVNQIICQPCKLAFPVRDGIPVMLVDEAEEL